MSKDNLELWKKVEKTNPKYTKQANVKGNRITSIAPQFQVMNVTEQFGIYGQAWGFKNIDLDYSLAQSHGMVIFKATFFFPQGEFPIINSISLFMDNARTKIDDNFAKKVETDALTKAISKLGFNADIFLGKFDDSRYLQEVTNEYAQIEKENNKKFATTENLVKAKERGFTFEKVKEYYKVRPEQEQEFNNIIIDYQEEIANKAKNEINNNQNNQ